ncbi:MFS transporter, partial [Pseudomonas syringae pv. tagetis]
GAVVLPYLAYTYWFVVVFTVSALFCLIAALFAGFWLYEPDFSSSAAKKQSLETSASPLKDFRDWRFVLAIGGLCGPHVAI